MSYDYLFLLFVALLLGTAIKLQENRIRKLSQENIESEKSVLHLNERNTQLESRVDTIKTELMQTFMVILNEKQRRIKFNETQQSTEINELNGAKAKNEEATSSSSSSTEVVRSKEMNKREVKEIPNNGNLMTQMLTQSSAVEVDGDDVLSFLDARASTGGTSNQRKSMEVRKIKEEEKPTICEGGVKRKRKNNINHQHQLMPSSSSEEDADAGTDEDEHTLSNRKR